uniref:RxLR effector candidate protein n=1 Tax=Hyaloperonospora arabidopsidis (strain Emoy2) TaxID=559515 RepID=M4BZM0_HYAAE
MTGLLVGLSVCLLLDCSTEWNAESLAYTILASALTSVSFRANMLVLNYERAKCVWHQVRQVFLKQVSHFVRCVRWS